MKHLIKKADILIEALPYIRQFKGKTFVIKYGGKAMSGDVNLKNSIIEDIVLMKFIGINPVIIHGGGPEINIMMKKKGLKPKFVNGLRVTDKKTMRIVEKVLFGKINKELVLIFNEHRGKAVGLSGKTNRLIIARKHFAKVGTEEVDIGFVGDIVRVNVKFLQKLKNFIPVIAPIGIGKDNCTYNINADDAASAIAVKIKAEKLILLTDVDGIYKNNSLLSTVTLSNVPRLIKNKVIEGGMIPKVKAGINALKGGVKKVHIINGNIRHSLLLEIFTNKGIGTEVVK